MTILDRLGQRSKTFLITLGFLLVALQSVINYLAGPDLSFVLFYLLPVSLVAWLVHRRAAILVSLASAAGHFSTELMFGYLDDYPSILYFNAIAWLGGFLFVTYFVSALRRSHDHERELARTDDLTGAINRRSFFEASQQEINRARKRRHPFTVAYMDVDDFKFINDNYGHSIGDTVLKSVTETIQNNIREIDVVARLGGDEFVILMRDTGEAAAQVVVTRVHQKILDTMREYGWPITFSIGVVTWMTPPRTVDIMLKLADEAMYEVKNGGKNRVTYLKLSGEPVAVA